MNNSTTGLEIVQQLGASGATGEAAANGGGLPCLNSDISIEKLPEGGVLTTQHRRTAHVLAQSVQQLSSRFGLECLGFLTLTFAQHILCPKEAQRRLNSLLSNVIKKRYREYLGVFERQKSGRIHYHLLVVLNDDIRTGVDFSGLANRDYSTAGKALRGEWSFWRSTARKYGFGRTELLPIKSNTEAIGKYVGKYIAKHIDSRQDSDKGIRLVRYSRGARAGTTRFQFHSKGSSSWRYKVGLFAQIMSFYKGEQITDISDLSRLLGSRWAYHHRDFIMGLPDSSDDTTAPAQPTAEVRGAVCCACSGGQAMLDGEESPGIEQDRTDSAIPRSKPTVDVNKALTSVQRPARRGVREIPERSHPARAANRLCIKSSEYTFLGFTGFRPRPPLDLVK